MLAILGMTGAVSAAVVWDSVVRLTTDPTYQLLGSSGQRSMAVDPAGNVWVFWLDQRTVPYQLWYRRYDAPTRVWLPEERLTSQSQQCYPAAVVADLLGNIHLVWHMEAWPCRGIWYKPFDAARRLWLPETLFQPLPNDRVGRHPVITALAGSTRIAVAWYGHSDTSTVWQIVLRELIPDSGWTELFSVTSALCDHFYPALGYDAEGNLFVVWQGRDNGGVYNQIFCRRRVSGQWQPVEHVSDMPNAPDQYNPAISVSPDGGYCQVLWHGRRQSEIYLRPLFRQRTPSGWLAIEEPGGITSFQQEQVDIADLGMGRAAAVWRNQLTDALASSELLYCERDSTGYWSAPEPVIAINTGIVLEPTIAVMGRDIHVVWYDGSSGNYDIYYRHGTFASAVTNEAGRACPLPTARHRLYDATGRRIGSVPQRAGVYFLQQSGTATRKLLVLP